ncbi:MAG: bL35 family ribosomal protein [Patescibacteria group bacterium]|nr:50S ribosomal protein L35 [Patescibacteria group bacterium]
MPKLKTRKTISKRVKVTKNGKLKTRKAGQDHFNARESGKKTRNKRRDGNVSKTIARNVKRAIIK